MSTEVPNYEDFDDKQVKHREMIQAVVTRLAGNSFLVKGWALTVTGAFLGFAVNKSDSGLAATALIPITFFGALDMYYLRTERLFRALYERVRTDFKDPFFMAATDKEFLKETPSDSESWWRAFRGRTVLGFYGPLILAILVVVMILCSD